MIVNGVEFRPTILLFPLVVVELYIFALGIAFLLSTMFVRFRDIGHIWDVIMQAWFYATPIIYPLTQLINVGWLSIAKLVLMLNPIAQIIQDARYLVVTTQTETIWGLVGQQCWLLKLIPLLIIVIVLLVGVTVFRRRSPYFAEEL